MYKEELIRTPSSYEVTHITTWEISPHHLCSYSTYVYSGEQQARAHTIHITLTLPAFVHQATVDIYLITGLRSQVGVLNYKNSRSPSSLRTLNTSPTFPPGRLCTSASTFTRMQGTGWRGACAPVSTKEYINAHLSPIWEDPTETFKFVLRKFFSEVLSS